MKYLCMTGHPCWQPDLITGITAHRGPLMVTASEDESDLDRSCSVYIDRTGAWIQVMCW